eukprot:CAMPEP_0179242218 /NCGR_PEP_ID=MMETSP0797-20121207/16903_1 /TAXON_ID=47934 /ORGANISM="Dinophysis acuminata, Strain DAEP01" /LENGTH=278 /DNA_ID=CAMNT_0020949645 /DNA_START=1 /DNA_END=834 /DNA_ORIENTATION=+
MAAMAETGPPHKTVPMPGSLPELQQHAERLFGGQGCRLRLHHRNSEVNHPAKMTNIKDGDFVDVKAHRPRVLSNAGEAVLSTHHADFVQHPYQARPPPAMADDTSTLTDELMARERLPMQSSYKRDFKEHPYNEPEVFDDQILYGSHIKNFSGNANPSTTYKEHFPWRTGCRPPPAGTDDASTLTDGTMGLPFTSRSSYAEHFTPRGGGTGPLAHAPTYTRHSCTLSSQLGKKPFEASTSYKQHYVAPAPAGPQATAPPDTSGGRDAGAPFTHSSEYG